MIEKILFHIFLVETMVKSILLEDIKIGDITSEPVFNNYGQILLGSGMAINEKHIHLLRIWDINTVKIFKKETSPGIQDNNSDIQILALRKLGKRLLWKPRNNNEKDLVNLGIKRITQILLNG